jgi:alginate O-acetyltransferase complex protein AlgI
MSGALTFFCVMAAWVMFRAQTFGGAIRIYSAMVGITDASTDDPFNWTVQDWRFICLAAACFVIVFCMPNTQELFVRYRVSIRPEWTPALARPFIYWRATYPWLLGVAALAGIACFYQPEFPQFLYWGF